MSAPAPALLVCYAAWPCDGPQRLPQDPYLNGLYAASFVRGLQGDLSYAPRAGEGASTAAATPPLLAAATCKHLAVYNLEVADYGGEHWTRHRFQARPPHNTLRKPSADFVPGLGLHAHVVAQSPSIPFAFC